MAYLSDIYVVNLDTGGQVSLYKFKFGHSCFKYVNGEMLIGGEDGHLYKLDNDTFEDNEISYSDETYMKTSFEDWGLSENWKHNKKIKVHMSGDSTVSANLKLYKNGSNTPFYTEEIGTVDTWDEVFAYTGIEVYDLIGRPIGQLSVIGTIKKKFNYQKIMAEITDIVGDLGVEVSGIDFKTAIIGEK